MRSSSNLAILLGLFFLTFLAAVPSILTWQAQNTLEPYGALNKVDFVVQTALADTKVVRIFGAIYSFLMILAGVLVRVRWKVGYYLVVGISGMQVAGTIFSVVEAQSIPGIAAFEFILWGFVLSFILRKNSLHGANWWRGKAKSEA
jgi:hypothetical protein